MASSSHLEPGETGSIKATVKTAGKHGQLIKTVKVTTNDPSKKLSMLHLKMDVKGPLPGTSGANAIMPVPRRTLPGSTDDRTRPAVAH